jgi:predicted nucleic acid-binding protein
LSLVVDASMTIAWLFRDERNDLTRSVLRRVVAEGAIVPSIWRLEVANALRTAIRRRRCSEEYAAACVQRLIRLRIAGDNETDSHAWSVTWVLSREHGLTVYDAAYLELALRLGQPLASRDAALLNAAKAAGVDAVGD